MSERGGAGGRTVTWFVAVSVLALLGLALSVTGAAPPLQSVGQRVIAPVAGAVRAATAPVADFIANVGSYGRLRRENGELRVENERLRVELAQVREEEIRSGELNDLLGIGGQYGHDRVAYAAIIARDPNPLRDVVAINRGTSDGVQNGMAVLGKGGALVGTVERALERVAWVRLLSDSQNAVNGVVQESRALAVAAGTADRRIRMEFMAQDVVVKPGDTVLTSGLGGTYPPGLLVGRVAKVESDPQDVFQRVEIEPAARLASLGSVAVLTSFRPTPIEGLRR